VYLDSSGARRFLGNRRDSSRSNERMKRGTAGENTLDLSSAMVRTSLDDSSISTKRFQRTAIGEPKNLEDYVMLRQDQNTLFKGIGARDSIMNTAEG
jgi:hypothetical protein